MFQVEFDGVEIAAFTLADSIDDISADRRKEIVQAAGDAGVEIVGLHWLFAAPAGLQYLRPEIPAFALGSFVAALLFGELRSRGGSSPAIRFLLGAFVMIGALVFPGHTALDDLDGHQYGAPDNGQTQYDTAEYNR